MGSPKSWHETAPAQRLVGEMLSLSAQGGAEDDGIGQCVLADTRNIWTGEITSAYRVYYGRRFLNLDTICRPGDEECHVERLYRRLDALRLQHIERLTNRHFGRLIAWDVNRVPVERDAAEFFVGLLRSVPTVSDAIDHWKQVQAEKLSELEAA